MLWYIFQLLVFLSVSFTGVYYEWTPNGLALSAVALMSTMVATAVMGEIIRLISWTSQKLGLTLSKQRPRDRFTGRGRVL